MTIPIIVYPIGTSRALEEVTIRARVRGFLTERHFEYGSNVKKGQLLLVIDKKPFQVALDQAKAVARGWRTRPLRERHELPRHVRSRRPISHSTMPSFAWTKSKSAANAI